MARQTLSGVSGMSIWLTPRRESASPTAERMAGGAPQAPASPVQQGSWLRPVTQPPVDDEQLYNHRDACVPSRPADAAPSRRNC